MITGDNPLTACHVAEEVDIVSNKHLILDYGDESCQGLFFLLKLELFWKSTDESIAIKQDLKAEKLPSELESYDLCITGRALAALEDSKMVPELISRVWVYARVSPSQKEFILTTMKHMNYITLMCGDGTNDVGALKQAHIGIW